MKTLKKTAIQDWLNENAICGYKINADLTVDVENNVYLSKKNLVRLPIKFGKVSGFFKISDNELVTLKGSPNYVTGLFDCSNNKLVDLEGAPNHVGMGFYCHYNKLTSLKGAPKTVTNDFVCKKNDLTTLCYLSDEIRGRIDCRYNKITIDEIYNKLYIQHNKYNDFKSDFSIEDIERYAEYRKISNETKIFELSEKNRKRL